MLGHSRIPSRSRLVLVALVALAASPSAAFGASSHPLTPAGAKKEARKQLSSGSANGGTFDTPVPFAPVRVGATCKKDGASEPDRFGYGRGKYRQFYCAADGYEPGVQRVTGIYVTVGKWDRRSTMTVDPEWTSWASFYNVFYWGRDDGTTRDFDTKDEAVRALHAWEKDEWGVTG